MKVKQERAREQIYVDVAFWGGIVPGNLRQLRRLHQYGVVGFKCFLCPSGVDEFPHITEEHLEIAMRDLVNLDVTISVGLKCHGFY